jgi:hypothetical protein
MDLPVDPVHMSVQEILAVLHAGHRAAAVSGPEAVVIYLQRTLRDTLDLPHSVLMVIYDLLSEAQAELLDWDACSASLALAQEERKHALAEPPDVAVAPRAGTRKGAGAPAQGLSQTLAGVASFPRAESVDPNQTPDFVAHDLGKPDGAREATVKRCSICGKDVTHRSRMKDPVTKTYRCSECYGHRHGTEGRNRSKPGTPVLWITVLSLLVLIMVGLLILGIGGGA